MSIEDVDCLLQHIKKGNYHGVSSCLQLFKGPLGTCNILTLDDLVRETQGVPVAVAAYLGHAAIVELLIKFGFSPCEYADISTHVREDTHFSEDLDVILYYSSRRYGLCFLAPIHLASRMGHADIVRQLVVKHSVNVECLDPRSNTPLFYAVMFHRTDTVKTLAEVGADVSAVFPRTRSTPLDVAVKENQNDIVRILLESGADPDAKQNEHFSEAVWYGNVELARLLCCKDVDPERADHRGTPLQKAISSTNYEMVRYLVLELQVSLSTSSKSLSTQPFPMALDKRDKRIVAVLLSMMVTPEVVVHYHRDHPFLRQRYVDRLGLREATAKRWWSDGPIYLSDLQTLCVRKIRLEIVRNGGNFSSVNQLPLPGRLIDLIKDIYQRKPRKMNHLTESSHTNDTFDSWSFVFDHRVHSYPTYRRYLSEQQ